MNCPFSRIKKRYDVACESILECEHPNYPSQELADELRRFGKTLVSNRECQFVQELDYRQCPFNKSKNF